MSALSVQNEQQEDLFNRLPDDAVVEIFAFLGLGHFLYLAATCKRFKKLYHKEDIQRTLTSFKNATWSVSCAKMCFKESDNKEASACGIARMAGKYGRLKVLKWIYNHKTYCDRFEFLEMAARWGRVNVLQWAGRHGILTYGSEYNQKDFIKRYLVKPAVMNERINVLEFLRKFARSHGQKFLPRLVRIVACQFGKVAILDWMMNRRLLKRSSRDRPSCYFIAASLGRINVLDWLYDSEFQVDMDMVVVGALDGGNVEVLLWAWRHGAVLTESQYSIIETNAYLMSVQGLLKAECPWGNQMLDHARSHGGEYQSVVDWAVENGWA